MDPDGGPNNPKPPRDGFAVGSAAVGVGVSEGMWAPDAPVRTPGQNASVPSGYVLRAPDGTEYPIEQLYLRWRTVGCGVADTVPKVMREGDSDGSTGSPDTSGVSDLSDEELIITVKKARGGLKSDRAASIDVAVSSNGNGGVVLDVAPKLDLGVQDQTGDADSKPTDQVPGCTYGGHSRDGWHVEISNAPEKEWR